jgi:hypothetical protein
LGLRFDEPRRVARSRENRDRWENATPLFDAHVTKREVAAFWASQPFDLRLPNVNGRTPHGNCVGCFLKSAGTLSALFAEDPSRADWWIRMEQEIGATFRIDRPNYARLKEAVLAQRALDFGERDELTECLCHE